MLDRRELLGRGGRAALGAAVAPWWRLLSAGDSSDKHVKELAQELQGTVIGRTDAGYDAARRIFSTRFDSAKPLAVAYCENADDVARAIRWATRYGVHIRPRSGGHSYGGYSTGPGLVADVSRIDGVTV